MKVSLVSFTQVDPTYAAQLLAESPEAEHVKDAMGLMAYIARVSSPNQTNPTFESLLRYCAKHGHWSVFEMVDFTFEIVTSRAIAQQILRHRSFSFQEFSQRYAKATCFEHYGARRQDLKNRQNSLDDLPEDTKTWWNFAQEQIRAMAFQIYNDALSKGIAKECARFILPLSTETKLYMKGSLRSWIHYINVRTDPSAQLEHRAIAEEIKRQLVERFPVVGALLIPYKA